MARVHAIDKCAIMGRAIQGEMVDSANAEREEIDGKIRRKQGAFEAQMGRYKIDIDMIYRQLRKRVKAIERQNVACVGSEIDTDVEWAKLGIVTKEEIERRQEGH